MANPDIHPSSVVEDGASIEADVTIGPLCYIGGDTTIGSGTRLTSHVAIFGKTTIGRRNTVWPHVTMGADPQDLKYSGEESALIIGDHNDIRESVTIHLGTANGGGITKIGNNNLIMVGAHIAHDCLIGNHVLLTNIVQLAGHIVISDHAVIGGATAVHSYVTIGQFAFVGGMTRVTKDVPPFMTVEGNPATVRGVNSIGLERNNFDTVHIARLKEASKRLYRTANSDGGVGNMASNLAALADDHGDDPYIRILIASIKQSMIGLHGRYRESQRHDDRHRNPAR